jgi:hypothetical protein
MASQGGSALNLEAHHQGVRLIPLLKPLGYTVYMYEGTLIQDRSSRNGTELVVRCELPSKPALQIVGNVEYSAAIAHVMEGEMGPGHFAPGLRYNQSLRERFLKGEQPVQFVQMDLPWNYIDWEVVDPVAGVMRGWCTKGPGADWVYMRFMWKGNGKVPHVVLSRELWEMLQKPHF